MADRLKNPFAANRDDMGTNDTPNDDFLAFRYECTS